MHIISTSRALIFCVFFFFLTVNLVTTGGHTDIYDGVVTFLLAESMATHQSAMLHPNIPTVSNSDPGASVNEKIRYEVQYYMIVMGKYTNWTLHSMPLEPVYSTRSLMFPAVSIPFYFAALFISVSPILVISFFVNSIMIALLSLVIFCFSIEVYNSRKIAFLLGLIFSGCSFILPYNTSLFPQPLQSLLITSAVFFIIKSLHFHSSFICNYTKSRINNNNNKALYFASLGGIFLGLSVFANPTSIIVIPGFVVYSFFSMRHSKKSLICFLLTLSIMLFFMGLVNYLRFGSFTEFGYGSYFGTLSYNSGWTGLIGLLVSPGKGLIFYFPVVFLIPLALKYMYNENRLFFFLILYIIVVHWLYFGTLDDTESRFWSGGAWGPRYLIPVLPFIILALGTLLKHFNRSRLLLRTSLLILCAAGFIVNLPGTLVWSEYGTLYAWDRERLNRFPDSSEMIAWNPSYSPIILHARVLMEDYVHKIYSEQYLNTTWDYITYGLAPCSYDLFIFCKFGTIPIIALSAIGILLALKILSNGLITTSLRSLQTTIGLRSYLNR